MRARGLSLHVTSAGGLADWIHSAELARSPRLEEAAEGQPRADSQQGVPRHTEIVRGLRSGLLHVAVRYGAGGPQFGVVVGGIAWEMVPSLLHRIISRRSRSSRSRSRSSSNSSSRSRSSSSSVLPLELVLHEYGR